MDKGTNVKSICRTSKGLDLELWALGYMVGCDDDDNAVCKLAVSERKIYFYFI